MNEKPETQHDLASWMELMYTCRPLTTMEWDGKCVLDRKKFYDYGGIIRRYLKKNKRIRRILKGLQIYIKKNERVRGKGSVIQSTFDWSTRGIYSWIFHRDESSRPFTRSSSNRVCSSLLPPWLIFFFSFLSFSFSFLIQNFDRTCARYRVILIVPP